MEEVSAASCSIPIENNFKLYCLGIVESQYFCPCNGSMTVFALADFDETRKELQVCINILAFTDIFSLWKTCR